MTWRTGYWVRLVPWGKGWELHVDGVGVTQCLDRSEAETMVRELLEIHGREDAATAPLKFLEPRPVQPGTA